MTRTVEHAGELASILASELIAAGITIGQADKDLSAGRILARGEREFQQIKREIGIDLTRYRRACVRSLGTGAALAEFAIAEVPMAREERRSVTALGGLAILMVSAFDAALDGGVSVPPVFPRQTPPYPSLIHHTVDLYYRRLAALPQTLPQVNDMVEKAIARMYVAELQSVGTPHISRSVWWRKNVLPIALLGLPAWMAADSFSAGDFRRHFVWLCRLGEFFGWLDDCVDYTRDLAAGHANRIEVRLRSMSPSRLAGRIASQARWILSQWDAVNPASWVRNYFAVIVWTWIENNPDHALL
jgi:hypothetical protein